MANLRNKRISNLVVGNFANQSCSVSSFWRTGRDTFSPPPLSPLHRSIGSRIRNAYFSLAFSNSQISLFPFAFSTSGIESWRYFSWKCLFFASNETLLLPSVLWMTDGSLPPLDETKGRNWSIEREFLFRSRKSAGFSENRKRRG